jgi:hypothetical protein
MVMSKKPPEKIDRTLRHALDMLDCYGSPGAMAVCLLEDGSTLFRASGICQDPHGLMLGLQAIAESVKEAIDKTADEDHRTACYEVLGAVSKAVKTFEHPAAH